MSSLGLPVVTTGWRTALAVAACLGISSCSDSTGPGVADGEVRFDLSGERGPFSASGDLALDGGIPESADWAVAADPDSVGGIVVTAFEASVVDGTGDLFVLQLQPAATGTFSPCGSNEPCRGRLFLGWRTDFSGYDDWLEVTAGTVEIEVLSGTRVRGTFAFTLTSEGGAGSVTYGVSGGVFDVPFDDRAGGFICGLPPSVGCLTR